MTSNLKEAGYEEQTAIDEVGDSEVFVIATANDLNRLPESLIRSGRIDKVISIGKPNSVDSRKIMEYYLSTKRISEDVNIEDFTKMIRYSSCAALESILNEAAISAAYKRKESIEMDDLVNAVLRQIYVAPDEHTEPDKRSLREAALHEAGHLVMSEVLKEGSVGIVSIAATGRNDIDGVTTPCSGIESDNEYILVLLGGKAAVEMYFSERAACGCDNDLKRAYRVILEGITKNAVRGLGFLDVNAIMPDIPAHMNPAIAAVVQTELERYMLRSRDILIKNREFLEKVAEELYSKKTLLYSEIRRIRESVVVTKVSLN